MKESLVRTSLKKAFESEAADADAALRKGLLSTKLSPSDFEYRDEYRGDIYFFKHKKSGRMVYISDDGEFFEYKHNDFTKVDRDKILAYL